MLFDMYKYIYIYIYIYIYMKFDSIHYTILTFKLRLIFKIHLYLREFKFSKTDVETF